MKRNSNNKRLRAIPLKYKDLKKPFEFCCDRFNQDPETEYNMRNPPFESFFPETPWDSTRPVVKFHILDIGKAPVALPRTIAIYREKDVEIKKAATYGRSKKGRGPLTCFLEDEIEAARDLVDDEIKARREGMKQASKRASVRERRKSSKGSDSVDPENETEISKNREPKQESNG